MTGFVLQFVNVKIMVYGMRAYSAFILPHHDSVAAFLAGMCFLTMMGSLGPIVWAVAGASLQSVFQRHARVTNGLLGASPCWISDAGGPQTPGKGPQPTVFIMLKTHG